MSTRATYQFTTPYSGQHTVYIHHDGYPDGAAMYFYNAIRAIGPRGNFVDSFIRANPAAELTSGHDGHGDTVFQYDIDQHLRVTVRKYNHETETYDIYAPLQNLEDFINANTRLIEQMSRVIRVNDELTTLRQLEERVDGMKRDLESYRANFPTATGNIAGMEGRVRRMDELLRAHKFAAGLSNRVSTNQET